MKSKKADISIIRESFLVKRYHTVPHVHMKESVGHHTSNVIAILFWLYEDDPPIHLIRHALHHDVPEVITGDIPAVAKWRFQELKAASDVAENEVRKNVQLTDHKLEPIEEALLKFADMMDLCYKSIEEIISGNNIFFPILARGLDFCSGLIKTELKDHGGANEMYELIKNNPHLHIEEINEPKPAVH